MRYVKMNGAGNRFAIFDARPGGLDLTEAQARAIAAESKADQVIAIEGAGPTDRTAYVKRLLAQANPNEDVMVRGTIRANVRFWNADGGVTGACGNGSRAVAWLLLEELRAGAHRMEQATGRVLPETADEVTLHTEGGDLAATRAGNLRVTIDMGEPRLEWDQIPLAERMDTRGIDIKVGPIDNPHLAFPGAVNMGNPHVVFFVGDAGTAPVAQVGPMIEHHMLFPERANVGFAQILGPDRIRLRVWERGTGETAACGTGACAALVAAHRRRLTGRTATIVANGGELFVEWRQSDNHVLLTGPVAFDGEGEFAL
jgi:diaminopimelate epimerase